MAMKTQCLIGHNLNERVAERIALKLRTLFTVRGDVRFEHTVNNITYFHFSSSDPMKKQMELYLRGWSDCSGHYFSS